MQEFLDRVDPDIRDILTLDIIPPLDFSPPIAEVRQLMLERRQAVKMPEVPGVSHRDVTVPGYAEGDPEVTLRIYDPDDRSDTTPAIYWIHGGGMVAGSYDGDEFLCKSWAAKHNVPVISVEYRLAPEHPYPAPLHDCVAGLNWTHQNAAALDIDPNHIVLIGASAGGGLAAGTALHNRDHTGVPLKAQILIFPMIDDRDSTPSNQEITYPKCWHRDANRFGWSSYLGALDGTDDVPIYAAPARATVEQLRGLPPAAIDVGELDAFRDEDIEYAQKLLQAGVATDLLVTTGAFHASESYNFKAASSQRINAFRAEHIARALGR